MVVAMLVCRQPGRESLPAAAVVGLHVATFLHERRQPTRLLKQVRVAVVLVTTAYVFEVPAGISHGIYFYHVPVEQGPEDILLRDMGESAKDIEPVKHESFKSLDIVSLDPKV